MAFRTEGTSLFVVALKHWRDIRGYSRDRLAALVGCEPKELEKIESGLVAPSAALAARADEVLRAGGAVIASMTDRSARTDSQPQTHHADPENAKITVRRDDTSLDFDGSTYRVRHVRRVVNTGAQPLSNYTVRISVDRYPGSPERSRQHHRMHPLDMTRLRFAATCDSRPVTWDLVHDGNAYKEIRLRLADQAGRPLIGPGEETDIEFGYEVGTQAWGKWLQRVVRYPTLAMSITITFPAGLRMAAWGHQLVGTAAALPISALVHRRREDADSYSWSTVHPEVDSVFRFEWGPRAKTNDDDEYAAPVTARQTMEAAGIIQSDNPMLREKSRTFDLPAEAEQCREVLHLTSRALDRLARVHRFGKGQGIAAVQLGILRAAATIRFDDGQDINLINPRILHASSEADVQFEGCLSFFDVRGRVARPRTVELEWEDLTGNRIVRVFRDGAARMVAHEVDHIDGILYSDRMSDEEPLVPLSLYSGIGKDWSYAKNDE
jgi:peptide deformylase